MVKKETIAINHHSSSYKKSAIYRISKKQRAILKEIALSDIDL